MAGGNILENVVRIGEVQSVDSVKKTARVKFDSLGGLVSGPLKVLQQFGQNMTINNEHTHTITDTYSGGGSASTQPAHSHTITYWMPSVGQMVVCLYIPVDDGDGFVLGGLP